MDINNFLTGAITGVITKTTVAPLERMKILHQIQIHKDPNKYKSIPHTVNLILKEEGFLSFYKGNYINCLRIIPTYALKFGLNDLYKTKIKNYYGTNTLNFSGLICAGMLSGFTQNMVTYPLELLRTRFTMKDMNYSIYQYSKLLLQKEGFSGFYKGLSITLLSGSLFVGLQLSTFEQYKRIINKYTGTDTLSTKFLCGSLAGLTSQTISFPGDVIKKRMHSNGILGEKRMYKNTIDCMKQTWMKEGWKGFYTGYKLNMLRSLPASAIQFGLYDIIKNRLLKN